MAATLSAFVAPGFRQTYLDTPWPCLTSLLLRCLNGQTDLSSIAAHSKATLRAASTS
jgi:hypothetical protein